MAAHYLDNAEFEVLIVHFQCTKREVARIEMLIEEYQATKVRKKSRGLDYKTETKEIRKLKNRLSVVTPEHNKYKEELVENFYELACNAIRNHSVHLPIALWDDGIQGAVITCLEKVDRFNPLFVGKYGKKSKAFNYVSTCIINHYKGIGRQERRENEFKSRYFEEIKNSSN